MAVKKTSWKDSNGVTYYTWTEDGIAYLEWIDKNNVQHTIKSDGSTNSSFMSVTTSGKPGYVTDPWTPPSSHEFDGYTQFIKNNLLGTTIPIILLPDSVSDSLSTNYNKEQIIGRSESLVGYSDTANRTISFSVTMVQDLLPSGNQFKSLEGYCNALRALCYPTYTSGKIQAPGCTVYLGALSFSGVCDSCNVEYSGPVRKGERIRADIQLSFIKCSSTPQGAADVAGASSLSSRKTSNKTSTFIV